MDACAVHSSLWEILEQITENLGTDIHIYTGKS